MSKKVYPEALEVLREHCDIDYAGNESSFSREEMKRRLADKQGLVCQLTDRVDDDVLAAAPGLKVVSNVAVGYDNIDVPACSARDVVVTNTPGVLTETTADMAFALLMATARRVVEADRFVRSGQWGEWKIDLLCGTDVYGSTLGIVGMGRIGKAMARRARGFGMRVLYFNRTLLSGAEESQLGVEFANKDRLLADSDFVSIHVALTPDTKHSFSSSEFQQMKTSAILVNTARGPVVDEEALVAALASGDIAGAGLDVFEAEPKVQARLLEMANVALAPHLGSASVATRTRMCTMAAENCLAMLTGERPPNPVNVEILPLEEC